MDTFGQIIRQRRLEVEYSLRELAEKTKLAQSYISSLEFNREGKVPSQEVVEIFAESLGINKKKLYELSLNIDKTKKPIRKNADAVTLHSFRSIMKKKGIFSDKEALEALKKNMG